MAEYNDLDCERARTIIVALKEAKLLNTPDVVLTDKEYLHLWDTVLELQHKLKELN